MYATIEPVQYRLGEATALLVRGISVRLGDRAYVEWVLVSQPRKEFESGNCLLEGEAYAAWGDNDQYILTWLCEQLNLTLISIEPGDFLSSF